MISEQQEGLLLTEEQIIKTAIAFWESVGEPLEIAKTMAMMLDVQVSKAILQTQLAKLASISDEEIIKVICEIICTGDEKQSDRERQWARMGKPARTYFTNKARQIVKAIQPIFFASAEKEKAEAMEKARKEERAAVFGPRKKRPDLIIMDE